MISRKELIDNKELAYDKALGALAGLAIGDSFGDASRKPENQLLYGITTDFNEGASWSTDDTEFGLLTATTLIKAQGNPTAQDFVDAWLEHVAVQDDFPRGGASEIEGARNLKRGILPPYSGMYNSYYNSDGSAMRISPIGIICAGDVKKACELAEIDASLSHYREGIWGAQAVAAAVATAMVDGTIDEIIEAALSVIPKDSWLYYTMNKTFEIIDEQEGDFFKSWMLIHDELWTSYKAVVPEAIASAFGVLKLVNKDFKTGVIAAGNFGRDADTIGAIVGAILGAKYGASNIPERWLEKTRYPSGTCLSFTKGLDVKELSRSLAELIK
ncbi:ADP-ribosylglycohydrolase family protein [Alloiococcus sp. CFN-8]|uniref:ADP-ribosylglycohydrolase family protein n=1 Tax=Alloiococcus sp. CFN-8 TaxID=3416081 RepID=UPI003CED1DB8